MSDNLGDDHWQMSANDIRPLLVDVETFCTMIGCGRTKAYEYVAAQAVRSCRCGGSRRIDVASIHALKDRLLAGGAS